MRQERPSRSKSGEYCFKSACYLNVSNDWSPSKFDAIRAFSDEEVPMVLKRIISNRKNMVLLLRYLFPKRPRFLIYLLSFPLQWILRLFSFRFKSVSDFQIKFTWRLLHIVFKKSISQLTLSGTKNINTNKTYLFISNHIDIMMDPSLLGWVSAYAWKRPIYCATGNNLMRNDSVADLMRLNRAFIVNRSVKSLREQYEHIINLSQYIHYLRLAGNHVWIAQRQGRSKDNQFKTEVRVLKMLYRGVSDKLNFQEALCSLQIVPVAFSYEWDPCDIAKIQEQMKRHEDQNFRKRPMDDIRSIALGFQGDKGKVHCAFGTVINGNEIKDEAQLASVIDEQVVRHFCLMPSHLAAYAMLWDQSLLPDHIKSVQPNPLWASYYGHGKTEIAQAKEKFIARIAQLNETLGQALLFFYARPVITKVEQNLIDEARLAATTEIPIKSAKKPDQLI